MSKTMKAIKVTLITTLAIIMALTIIHNKKSINPQSDPAIRTETKPVHAGKRVSRFLQQQPGRNPRAADHCKKDNEICSYVMQGRNTTCCNNKCIDLGYDDHNCGACKNKCAFTEACCRGQCVNLAFDKRNCGICNNRCMDGGYCIYGMCDYA